jgi:MFS family permease
MQATARDEWRHGWSTVLIAFTCYGIAGCYSAMTTLFIGPLESEFGWSRTTITLGLSMVGVLGLVLSPFIGLLVDRWGTKRVGLPGLVLYCGGLALLSTVSGNHWHWWALWLIVALGAVLAQANVWITAVSKRFDRTRGKALALMMCGNGAAVAIYPLFLNRVIETYGWRAGYLAFGGSAALVTLPALILFFHDTGRDSAPAPSAASRATTGLGVREAMLSTVFVRIFLVTVLMTAAIVAINVHMMPMMIGFGLTRDHVAAALPLVGIGAVIGRLGTGTLLDRFPGNVVGAIGFLVPAIAVLIMLLLGLGGPLPFVVTFLFGMGLGVEIDVVAYISTRYFGLKNHGVLFGTITGGMAFAAGFGPMLAGAAYDLSGSYTILLMTDLALFVLSSLMVGSLGAYPDFGERADPSAAAHPFAGQGAGADLQDPLEAGA